MHRLSVVIVNYNVRELLLECLRRVQRASKGIDAEVFVVDNASSDGSREAVTAAFPSVRFIENAENVGFAKANNIAIRQCNSQYILLLNPDLFIEDDTLQKVLAEADKLDDLGALGARMVDGDGRYLGESKRNRPTLWRSFCKIAGLASLFKTSKLFASYYNVALKDTEQGRTDVLCGAFMLLNSAALGSKALLPECYFMFGEDIDLSVSILEAGYRNYYLPVTVTHLKGKSTNHRSRTYYEAFYGSMAIYTERHSRCWLTKKLVKFAVKLIIEHKCFWSQKK